MPEPLYQSRPDLFGRLRLSILSGVFPPGARMPASRTLAQELGVARQTVVAAYEQLADQGYVHARIGAGTFVATDLPDQRPAPSPTPSGTARLSRRGAEILATTATAVAHRSALLAPGIPAAELFPARTWAACVAHACRTEPTAGYPDPLGLPALRMAIAAHLAATRGLLADPGCILVTAGTQQALRIAAEILLDPGDAVWVEDPGYIAGRGAMMAAGATPVAVPSDGAGLDVAAGWGLAPLARMALVAPSHSTPLGGAMPVGRRAALLEWAAGADAWVLEDDCDSEFRWTGKPLPPLATLDRVGRVVYCGTFSKTMTPGLRVGFAVLPASLMPAALRARTLMDRGPGTLAQAALAEFMRRGLLAPHIRRMRTEYARRRDAVLQALARYCPSVEPVIAPGGLHMVARLAPGIDDRALTRSAQSAGLGIAPLSAYFAGRPRDPGIVLGFASTPVPLAADAARRLERSIASLPR
ncbi:MAG: PLP-dependent aminotransferase family protein [Gemmatimonadaceae bacterium]|nr:PLP-dependent aminotransferase family protein [Acetobacteraceae bacterium]